MADDLLVTGAHGQLGRAVLAACRRRGLSAAGHDVDTLDITDRAQVGAAVSTVRPKVVYNCAAFTAVDRCESEEALATRVNGHAVGFLAEACTDHDALLLQISTDYVFAGDSGRPYTEDDPPRPVNAYGRSKLLGEAQARRAVQHLIVRTAWLYGHGGNSFVEAIRGQLAGGRRQLRVVADQRGCPTFCDDLAEALLDLVEVGARGTVHAANSGHTTWHGLAEAVVDLTGFDAEVLPVGTDAFPRPAPRPACSILATDRLESLLGRPMPPWRDALERYLCAS